MMKQSEKKLCGFPTAAGPCTRSPGHSGHHNALSDTAHALGIPADLLNPVSALVLPEAYNFGDLTRSQFIMLVNAIAIADKLFKRDIDGLELGLQVLRVNVDAGEISAADFNVIIRRANKLGATVKGMLQL